MSGGSELFRHLLDKEKVESAAERAKMRVEIESEIAAREAAEEVVHRIQ